MEGGLPRESCDSRGRLPLLLFHERERPLQCATRASAFVLHVSRAAAPLLDSKFVEFLVRTDEKIAEEMRAARCTKCSNALHLNSFPRKPAGVPPEWVREHFTYRLSFDCSVCSKRHTPPSVRVLEQRVYLGFAVVLTCAVQKGDRLLGEEPGREDQGFRTGD
jgi:hypothetical protein